MKKQHRLIDNNGRILAESSSRKKIEAKAARVNCEAKVVMVIIKRPS